MMIVYWIQKDYFYYYFEHKHIYVFFFFDLNYFDIKLSNPLYHHVIPSYYEVDRGAHRL